MFSRRNTWEFSSNPVSTTLFVLVFQMFLLSVAQSLIFLTFRNSLLYLNLSILRQEAGGNSNVISCSCFARKIKRTMEANILYHVFKKYEGITFDELPVENEWHYLFRSFSGEILVAKTVRGVLSYFLLK